MGNDLSNEINNAFETLKQGSGDAKWEWDSRFGVALVVVNESQKDALLAAVSQALPQSWTRDNLTPFLTKLAGGWGGLRAGQGLFTRSTSAQDEDPTLFAFWWPWGNNVMFSLRVGISENTASALGSDPESYLRQVFGL